ncbi:MULTISPECIES: hypothetical protein [Streptomycetaceae]|uniref:hypothetical protein n=1 Tax=Streptomycetaceae TaxID=2062 RepID=UPI000CDC9DB5|nr:MULTISPECIES: hypothetical protein [Streptomycetaceae]AUY47959.1 hypothetical protein C2142_02115 [Streptomyces sp. CB01881]MBP0449301.1 hypothetical protein [Kitasatospora sp. RG8]TYC76437.1 hypothetical protein EH183_02115 [Streptomyces sp. CB01881]
MRYEIRVAGWMSDVLRREGFPDLESCLLAGETVLVGRVVDEAHLYGLLARFQALGLRVTEFRQVVE